VYPDPYGVTCWDPDNYVDLEILIVNAALFEQITGEPPPPSPVSAAEYSRAGLPWFELYDEEFADIRASERLSRLETVKVKEDSAKPQTIRGIRIRK
jgi:hypothetical protein